MRGRMTVTGSAVRDFNPAYPFFEVTNVDGEFVVVQPWEKFLDEAESDAWEIVTFSIYSDKFGDFYFYAMLKREIDGVR